MSKAQQEEQEGHLAQHSTPLKLAKWIKLAEWLVPGRKKLRKQHMEKAREEAKDLDSCPNT